MAEIGMLLMQEPELLMLDEPIAGMSGASATHCRAAAAHLHRAGSIEHDMTSLKKIAHNTHAPGKIAEGPRTRCRPTQSD
jgi:urea transport system ATP-binding protein